jgi:hypothetical protein
MVEVPKMQEQFFGKAGIQRLWSTKSEFIPEEDIPWP